MIDGHTQLNELNNECPETHIEIIIGFCKLFDLIVRYSLDFLNYLEQFWHDYFLQMSRASRLNETDGKQLLGEEVYLDGVILFQLHLQIPGRVRQRVIASLRTPMHDHL
jgi:WASH complex subunit strumpellin